jgi:protein SCO1/2
MNTTHVLGASLAAALSMAVAGCGGPAGEGGAAPVFAEPTPVLHEVPPFELVADDDQPLTNATLLGKVWVASFIFTDCGDVCPPMVNQIRMLQHSLPEGSLQVSVSVDPDKDTPAKLKAYATYNRREPGKWILATGKWDVISELAQKGFYLGGGKRQIHSPRFGLVDKWGRLRGYYDSRDREELGKLVRDVNLLLAESTPAARSAPGKPWDSKHPENQ